MIEVSVTGVRALGRRLESTAARLGHHGLADLAGGLTDGIGNEVAMALYSVEHDWSRQRAQIVKYLEAAGRAARAAAEAYQQIEQELSRAAGGGGGARAIRSAR